MQSPPVAELYLPPLGGSPLSGDLPPFGASPQSLPSEQGTEYWSQAGRGSWAGSVTDAASPARRPPASP